MSDLSKTISLATLPETWNGLSREEQAEVVYYLQSIGMKQAEIAATADVKPRRIKSRSDDAKAFLLSGAIPTGNIAIEVDRKETVEIEKERRERLSISRFGRSVVGKEIYLDQLIAAVKESIPNIALTKYKPREKDAEEEVVWHIVSDLHNMRNSNGFTPEVARNALFRYGQRAKEIVEMNRKHVNVNTANIFLGGDLMHGTGNYGAAQAFEVSGNSSDQVAQTAKLLIEYILSQKPYYANLNVYCVPGNHGRKSRDTDSITDNYELDMYQIISAYFHDDDKVSVVLPQGNFYIIAESLGYKFLLMHGDTIKAGNPQGIIDAVKRYEDVLPRFDSSIQGHWHRCMDLPLPRRHGELTSRHVFVNGSASLEDQFLETFGSSPSLCWWLFFQNSRRVTSQYQIDLYEEAQLLKSA